MDRVEVRKTYKLFIGGAFPRSESGRSYQPSGAPQVNVARASRKDARDAVVAARAAVGGWSGRTGYNRGQILFRIAEMLETRSRSMVDELVAGGVPEDAAQREVTDAVDLVAWYAGMPDKLLGLLGSQNGVSGPFFNFSTVEPCGVVAVVAPARPSLVGLLAVTLPVLAGGNCAVCVVSEEHPLAGLGLGELLAVSDVPGGVINLLAGLRSELVPQLASHRDVDGMLVAGAPDAEVTKAAADNLKRVRFADVEPDGWTATGASQRLAWIEPFVETKTFWHPVAP